MDETLLYLFKVTGGTIMLYLGYVVFFSRDTFYLRNRIYLLVTLLLPVIIPLVQLPDFSDAGHSVVSVRTINTVIFSGTATGTAVSGTINSFDYSRLLWWVYISVTGILLLKVSASLVSTYLIIKKGTVLNDRFPKVIVSDVHHLPFSFFPYIVIPGEIYKRADYREILDHENAHVRQGHTFDLLLSELFMAFQWFNPIIWLIKRAIISNHEYLADRFSLTKADSKKEYQFRLLSLTIDARNIPLAHNFSTLIKNRITMINKEPTPGIAALKNIFILPVLAIVMYAFTAQEYQQIATFNNPVTVLQPPANISGIVKGIVIQPDGKPLQGAIVIVKGTSVGTVTGVKGNFKLSNVPEDAMLVVSYVGFKTAVAEPDFSSKMKITMMRSTINTETVNIIPSQPAESSSGAYLKIRSAGSSLSASPLIVLDGTISDIQLDKIDPLTIQSINVLKDQPAVEKYGDKGRDGVIEIITKKYDSLLKSKMSDVKVTGYGRENKADNKKMIFVEELPAFPGGENGMINWLSENVKYPADAVKGGITGKVYVNFIVSSSGKVKNVQVDKPVNSLLDAEAIRVISSMPDWKPGSQNGKLVDVDIVVPVEFSLK